MGNFRSRSTTYQNPMKVKIRTYYNCNYSELLLAYPSTSATDVSTLARLHSLSGAVKVALCFPRPETDKTPSRHRGTNDDSSCWRKAYRGISNINMVEDDGKCLTKWCNGVNGPETSKVRLNLTAFLFCFCFYYHLHMKMTHLGRFHRDDLSSFISRWWLAKLKGQGSNKGL